MTAKSEPDFRAFEMENVQPFYADTSAGARNATVGLAEDRSYRRRSTNRDFLHALHVQNAAKLLAQLPAPGESIHVAMRGNFHSWDLVPAVIRLAAPATIAALWVATLGFNMQNAEELVSLLDAKQIGRVAFICSNYFRATTENLFEFLHAQLTDRGQRVAALRSHAKLLLFELTDGRSLVIESSANLRSCRNVEQFCMTNDPGLLKFHAGWIEELLTEAGT